jgi:hypothetical protein
MLLWVNLWNKWKKINKLLYQVGNTMEILHIINKGRHMNTLKKYHIYRLKKNKICNFMKLSLTTQTPIFDTPLKHCPTLRPLSITTAADLPTPDTLLQYVSTKHTL